MKKTKLTLPLIRAKNQVTMKEYFYAVLMMGMTTVVKDDLPAAMGTDGKCLYINPKWIKEGQWTQDHMIFGFMHECIHVMTGDMWWANEFGLDQMLANCAADFWINQTLEAEGKIPPAHCLLNKKYTGWTKMQIYKDLQNQQQKQKQKQKQGGSGQDPKPGQGQAGKSDPFNGDVKPMPPDPNLKAEIGLRVKSAVQAAKSCGGPVPKWAQDIVDDIAKPKVNWKRRLHHLAQQIVYAKNDYSYRRHNRRYIPHNIMAPTLYSPEPTAGVIVCSVDTSGSVSQEELNQFWGEILEIMKSLSPRKLWVLDVDSSIRHKRCYTPQDDPPTEIEVHGRGGTSFLEPFQWIEDELGDDMPQLHIYLTDLEGGFPANAPPYPTIWVSTTEQQAPFGETIFIDVGREGY
ncbi:MAG: hypothetical protein GY906_24615 [bacterium]|nr:hypothetical protein [bacterium]